MENPDGLDSEKQIPQDDQLEKVNSTIEQTEENPLEGEIKEVQAELQENIGELNEHLDELEELQANESLPEKAKKVLMAGIQEIKNFVQSNPTINLAARIYIAGGVGLGIKDLTEGKNISEVATSVLGEVVFWGIAKAVAYLGWGKKERERDIRRSEREKAEVVIAKDGEAIGAQPVGEVEEPLPVEDDTESQIKKLKDNLVEKYDDN